MRHPKVFGRGVVCAFRCDCHGSTKALPYGFVRAVAIPTKRIIQDNGSIKQRRCQGEKREKTAPFFSFFKKAIDKSPKILYNDI